MSMYLAISDYYQEQRLEWRQSDRCSNCHVLYDGSIKAGIIRYNTHGRYKKMWSGTFQTSDNRTIFINPAGTSILQAKDRIEKKYLKKKDHNWWTK